MATAKKPTPRKKKGPQAKPRIDSHIFYPTIIKGTDGQPDVTLPSLVDAIIDMTLWHGRKYIVETLTHRYGLSAHTIDRAIAIVKDMSQDEMSMDRGDRIRLNYARLQANAKKAEAEGKRQAVTGAIREAATLAGDRRPDILVIPDNDQNSAALLAEARRLFELGKQKGA